MRRSRLGAYLVIGIIGASPFSLAKQAAGARGVPIVFENDSQYAIRELRLHAEPDYASATNILGAPLDIGAAISAHRGGLLYVTFFREKYEGGPVLAFTTARPIDLAAGRRFRVIIFDESFRTEMEANTAADESAGCGGVE